MSVDPVSLAITLALNAAMMAMTASKKIEGPRLSDLKASTADYGTPMVQFYGTMRLECFTMYIEDIREVKTQTKTKGGKYNNYTYFGTWASFIADNEIDAVLQIFLDRNLFFDVTGTGGPVEAVTGQTWRIHKGTETQDPDPRLLAKIEAKEGPGTCPAYLGISYIVFEDFPLEKFGNRYPQTSVVSTRTAVPKYPWATVAKPGNLSNKQFSPGLNRLYFVAGSAFQVVDVATKKLLVSSSISPGVDVGAPYAFARDTAGNVTNIYAVNGANLTSLGLDGGQSIVTSSGVLGYVGCGWAGGALYLYPGVAIGNYIGILGNPVVSIPVGHMASHVFTNAAGDSVAVGTTSGNILSIASPADAAATLINTAAYGSSGPAYGFDNGTNYVVRQAAHLFLLDKNTFAIVGHTSDSGPGGLFESFDSIQEGAASFWNGLTEYNSLDLSVIRSVSTSSWAVTLPGGGFEAVGYLYDQVTHALLSVYNGSGTTQGIIVRYLDRKDGQGWLLGDICADVAGQCGMAFGRFDFSDLDQLIPGYAFTQGPGKQIVGALLDLHDSDIRPHGFIQQGLKRGQPYSAGPISTEWMVRENRQQDAASSPLYSIPITSETDLPLRIAATFSDPNMEYQPNTVRAQRNAASVKTSQEVTLDLSTLNEQPDVLQPLIERGLRRYWVGSSKPAFLLTPLEIRLEPADVRPLLLEDGESLRIRNTKTVIRANRIIQTEWEVDGETQVNPPSWETDNASPLNVVYSTPGGFTYGRDPDTIPVTVPTKLFVFDTPLLADSDDQTAPFVYDAAAPYAAGTWLGTSVWSADTNEADSEFVGGFDLFLSSEPASFGFCSSTLPAAASDVMDEASVLTVQMAAGASLSSVTTTQLLADQSLNLALVGDELIQFRDATEISTDVWQVSGLIRGARNSEYAVATHGAGETFLLINSRRHKVSIGASEIGDTDYYKASLTGSDLSDAPTVAVAFAANAHRPPAPAHLALVRDPATGDWAISWTRRTRIGGGNVDGTDVPLGETSEAYRVKIMSGSAVLKTYDSTSPSLTYTNAEQVTQWGGAQTSLTVEVCQLSPALSLEGFVSTASA